jgi:ribonuclease HI
MKKYKENIQVFTDGSRTPTHCGYGVHFVNLDIPDISKKFTIPPLTNQRSELYAIHQAIKTITENYDFKKLEIYSDSEYSIKSLTIWIKNWKKNNWMTATNKPVLNTDIIKEIDSYLQQYPRKIKFIHVRAHTEGTDFNSIHNEIADKLAKGVS